MTKKAGYPALSGLYTDRELLVESDGDELSIRLHAEPIASARLHRKNEESVVSIQYQRPLLPDLERQSILALAEMLFSTRPNLERFELVNGSQDVIDSLAQDGIFCISDDNLPICQAELFWQYAPIWLPGTRSLTYPQKYVMSDGRRHPMRRPKRYGVLYRRYVPWVGQTLTFELAEQDRMLSKIHQWMNNPRVAHFWSEQGDLEAHRAYIGKQLANPHVLPVIGHFDGSPFGYFEIYWAKEDRIAPYYDAQDYDRGIHLLVGEESFRGQGYYTAWFSSICHYLFLDDPRTQRIVCEPRSDNHRQIGNFDRSGFAKVKSFDFPHKNALLVMLLRERFFAEHRYLPDTHLAPAQKGIAP